MIFLLILVWGLGMIPTYLSFQNPPFPPMFEYPWDYIFSFFWPLWVTFFIIVFVLDYIHIIDLE